MMKRHLIALSLVFALFLAGCIGQPPTLPVGLNGVVITSFFPEPAEIEPEMTAILPLIVKNVGGMEATDILVELMGLTDEWAINGVTPSTAEEREESIGSLIPPAPERGLPEGQEGYYEWVLTPPIKNVTMSYDMSARVYYGYSTDSESLLRVISMTHFKTLSEEERAKRDWGIRSSKSSSGPLVITVKAPTPIVTRDTVTTPLWFEIQNAGGGRAFKSGTKPDGTTLDVLEVKVSGAGIDCDGTTKDVRLINGKSGRLYCKVSVSGIETYKDFEISLKTSYRYYVDAYSSITVLKSMIV